MDNYNLKRQLIGEIQEAIRVKELNVELMEQVAFTGMWLLKYCERNQIAPPNLDRLHELIQRSRELVQRMYEPYSCLPTDSQQRKETPDKDNSTIVFTLTMLACVISRPHLGHSFGNTPQQATGQKMLISVFSNLYSSK